MVILVGALIVIIAVSCGCLGFAATEKALSVATLHERKLLLNSDVNMPHKVLKKPSRGCFVHSSVAMVLVSVVFHAYGQLPSPRQLTRHIVWPMQFITRHYELVEEPEKISGILFWQILVAAATSLVLSNFIGVSAIFFAILQICAPHFVLAAEDKRHQKVMREQLIILVEELIDSLKASKSFAQALQMSVSHMQPPMKEHLEKVASLMACGMPADEAFSQGMKNSTVQEAQALSAALQVQYRTGGNLMVLLTEFASQFRQSLLFNQNLYTQTAQGRLSVKVVAVVPPLLIAAMSLISPGYLDCFFSSSFGRGLFVGAISLDILGLFLVKRLMSVSEI